MPKKRKPWNAGKDLFPELDGRKHVPAPLPTSVPPLQPSTGLVMSPRNDCLWCPDCGEDFLPDASQPSKGSE